MSGKQSAKPRLGGVFFFVRPKIIHPPVGASLLAKVPDHRDVLESFASMLAPTIRG